MAIIWSKALKLVFTWTFQLERNFRICCFSLLRVNDPGLTTLAEYIKQLPAEQTEIYYASGKDRAAVERLPQMELLKEKNYEVLYLFDRVDEFAIDTLREYQGKHFKSISRGDLNLASAEAQETKKAIDDQGKENESLLKAVKDQLEGKVVNVRSVAGYDQAPFVW